MWEKPEQLTAVGLARPMRVAYLVDTDHCPTLLLDKIFAECYGRWGGRRTLIVPTSSDGVDPRYADWLYYFDPDVVYSFLTLSDSAIAAFHERYAPAYLVRHHQGFILEGEEPRYTVDLPLHALSSLSVVPTFASHNRDFDGPPQSVVLLDKYWDSGISPFIQENFGFLSTTFSSTAVATAHPDVFSCMSLITEAALENRRLGKDKRASYMTSEDQVLDALGSPGGPLTLAQLAELYTPYLDTGQGMGVGTTLVAGDSAADRILFWNVHNRYARGSLSNITALRLPADRIEDHAYIGRVRQLIERRGVKGHNGRNDSIFLCSASLDQTQLDSLAERLRKAGPWLVVRVGRLPDHAAIIPAFRDPARVWFHGGGVFAEPESRATSEYKGKRFALPIAIPWHMREALPPTSLRQGHWMVDVTAERHMDHCSYANQRDVWMLPRRLRFERMFKVEREGGRDDHQTRFIRPTRTGAMAMALSVEVTRASATAPEDIEAFRGALCNDVEWTSFERFKDKGVRVQPRFAYASLSDKGRYLLGVLALFDSVPGAFQVLMNGYWRDVLLELGASPAEKNEVAKAQLLRTLRKRLRRDRGPLTFETDEQCDRLAREALRAGRMLPRETRFIPYTDLQARWEGLVDKFIKNHPRPEGQDNDDDVRDAQLLDRSIQHLCARELLFQGREWQCQTCYNRNWVSLDAVQRRLTCTVCRNEEPAPVAGDWHFRANPFVIEAYRDHGSEPVIWALWQLSDRARRSFYFAPSMRLWLKYPENPKDEWDAEIDAVAVADGKVYAVEGKSSSGIDDHEIAQLVLAAERIRPDVLLVVSMEAENNSWRRGLARLASKLPAGTALEALHFSDASLERTPYLPA